MIDPDSLNPAQKQYLRRTYGLDAEACARPHSSRRRVPRRLWLTPALALGVCSGAAIPAAEPLGTLAAAVAWVLGVAHVVHPITMWLFYRSGLRTASIFSNESRSALIWERVGPGAPPVWRWIVRAGALALVLAAAVTERRFLAGTWLVASVLELACAQWKDAVVRRELDRIDRVRALPTVDRLGGRAVAGGATPGPSTRRLAYPSRGFLTEALRLRESNADFCIIVAKDDPRREMAVRWLAGLLERNWPSTPFLQSLYEKVRMMHFISATVTLDDYAIAYGDAENGDLVVTLKAKRRGAGAPVVPLEGRRGDGPARDDDAE